MEKKISICVLYLIVVIIGCVEDEKHYAVTMRNASSKAIGVYLSASYPDTLVNCPSDRYEIVAGGSYKFDTREGWEEVFKSVSKIQFFIIDLDTIKIVSCDSIRLNNKILHRYELSYNELNNQSWTITYK